LVSLTRSDQSTGSALALKTCEVLAAHFAVKAMLTNEESLAKAKIYETAWEHGAERVKKARVSLKELEHKIEESDARRIS
jgi:hypothetical protein